MQSSPITPNSQTPLTVNNFFKYFITKPWSKHLGTIDKIKAWLASGALALFCFIPQIICRCFLYDKSVKKVTVKNPDADPKTDAVRKNKLNTSPSPSPTQSPTQSPTPSPIASPRSSPEPSPQPIPPPNFKPITSIVIEDNHPLNQPQDLFFPEERAARASGTNPDAVPDGFHTQSFPGIIEHFQNRSLMQWRIDKKFENAGNAEQRAVLNQRIDARLAVLNQAVQLEARLEAHPQRNYYRHVDDLKMIDLELPWEKSGLMIALMNDEEFNRLTIDQIRQLHPRQLQQVKIRFATLKKSDVISLGYYDSAMTLREFSQLHRDVINANLKKIDPVLMDFLTKEQIQGLATQDLSKEQFDVLFPVKYQSQPVMTYRMLLLDKAQVEGCLSKDLMDGPRMRALSTEQMKRLVLSQVKIELFNELFRDIGEGYEENSRIKELDLEKQIYPHLDRFQGTQLRTLSPEQIKSLDLKRIRKEHFDVIFPKDSRLTNTRIGQLVLKQVYDGWDYFDAERLRHISDTVLPAINFTDFKLDPDKFNALFPAWDLSKTSYDSSNVRKLIPSQILALWSMFDKTRLFYLRPEQLKELDFRPSQTSKKKSPDQVEGLFPVDQGGDATSIATDRMQRLDFERHIYPIVPSLSGRQLNYMSATQLRTFDFARTSIRQDQFDTLFPKWGVQDLNININCSRLNQLDPKQVYQLLPLLDTERLAYFNPEKILEFDLTCFKGRLHELFNLADEYRSNTRARMQKLDLEKHIYPMWQEWNGGHLYHLSPAQLQQLDFKRYRLTTDQFNGCFPAKNVEYGNIRYLQISQLLDLQEHLDRERLAGISEEQVPQFDLTTLPSKFMEGMFKVEPTDSIEQRRMTNGRIHAISDEQITKSWAKLPDWLQHNHRLEGRAKRLGVIT